MSYANDFKPYGWMVGTGVYIDDLDVKSNKVAQMSKNTIKKDTIRFASLIFVAAIFGSIALFILLKIILTKPLNQLIDATAELSTGDGDLTRKLPVKGKDELSLVNEQINNFIEKVRVMTISAKDSANENSSIAHELSQTTLEVGKLMENSANLADESNQQSEEIKNSLINFVKEAQASRIELESVNEKMRETNEKILKLGGEIQQSAQTEIEMSAKIQQLSQDAEQVKDVLTVINDIADQTNLLALNAAIEAARAGEHGRGFAVVADEVRQLAERTQKSLTEINATINVVVQAINDSSDQMSKNSKKAEELSKATSSVENDINEMTDIVNKTSTVTADKLEQGYIDTQKDIDNIASKIFDINKYSTENARSIEEIASASEHMNKMTEELNDKLSEFKTN